MTYFLSDDGKTVIVETGADEPEQLTIDEFKEAYGAEMLEERDEKETTQSVSPSLFNAYYTALLDFLNAVGSYLHLVKLDINAADGIYPVQRVAREYGHEGASCDQEIAERERKRWQALRHLSEIGQKVGFLPIDEKGQKLIMDFVEDCSRRSYIRSVARREKEKGVLLSIADLMRRRYEVEKKKKNSLQKGPA